MASRKQKRARKFRARAHQDAIRGTDKLTEHTLEDGTAVKIVQPRGPKSSPSRHASDPPRYGLRGDSRDVARQHLISVGIENPSDEACYEFSKLVQRCGGNVADAKRRLEANLQEAYDEVAQRMVDTAVHGFTAVDGETGERIDPKDVLPTDHVAHKMPPPHLDRPTEAEWDEFCAEAKRRKRGVGRIMAQQGYALVSDADPKDRMSWVKS